VSDRPKVPPPSDEALNDVAAAVQRALTRPGDELDGMFMFATALAPDGQRYMQAMMWPTEQADEIREALRRFLDGRPGWEGGPSWEEPDAE
jgi:hypothetical protein